MAWLPPSRHDVHRSLRIPDLRKGDDSPLRTSSRRVVLATCRSPTLPTPRIPRCALSVTSQTRSPPCAGASSTLSSGSCHDAHAVALQLRDACGGTCDAVVLEGLEKLEMLNGLNFLGLPPAIQK